MRKAAVSELAIGGTRGRRECDSYGLPSLRDATDPLGSTLLVPSKKTPCLADSTYEEKLQCIQGHLASRGLHTN